MTAPSAATRPRHLPRHHPPPARGGARRGALVALALAAALLLALWGAVEWLNRDREPAASAPGAADASRADPAAVAELGARLARIGNCAGCHTAPGGAAYAGGRAVATPFGSVFAGNLTPDAETGLGRWSADDFWRALHHGRARDGRLLYPAFPYPNFTRVTRADSDALYAHLRTLAPVRQANRPHALRWPFDHPAALKVWRALYFRPGVYAPRDDRDAEWNRGAYLVQGLGHCAACHAPRDALGGAPEVDSLAGAELPALQAYAPALDRADEGGVADWPRAEVVQLLRDGVAPRASVLGPMAEVVQRSLQHVAPAELQAMAAYLQQLPPRRAADDAGEAPPADPATRERGAQVYRDRCADCHGEQGEGLATADGRRAYPALAGNRAVTLASPTQPIRTVLVGGFTPATAGQPRPFGMPPFGGVLGDADIAAVVTHIRQAWGPRAGAVQAAEVERLR